MADGPITIPYQPGQGPDAGAAAATAAPAPDLRGTAVPYQSPQVSATIPTQPLETLDNLKQQSWGARLYHGVLSALGGKYNTQYVTNPDGTVARNQVANTPGQQWKNIIAGALSGLSGASAAGLTGPGAKGRALGAGIQAGYRQRTQATQDEQDAALKMATSNAQTAKLSAEIAESTWRLANSQRQASDEILTGFNNFNQLVSAGGEGSTDLGAMSWNEAKKLAKEWPQLHHEQANGRLITMQDVDPATRTLTGKVRVAWVTNDWMNSKTTQDYSFTQQLPDEKGKTQYKTFNIPAGALTNGDLSKLIMSQGSEWGKQALEEERVKIAQKEEEDRAKLIPSEMAKNQASAALDNASAAAKREGMDEGDWGPEGQKGFNSWHDKMVTPALQQEQIYRLSSNVYNEYQKLRQQGKNFPTGAQSVQFLANHIAGTFGTVKGARVTKDMIEKHLGARGVSDSVQVAFQKLSDGDQLSPDQWDAFFSLIGQRREESWQTVLDDAQAERRPIDLIAFPADFRREHDLPPGHVPPAEQLPMMQPATGPRMPTAAAAQPPAAAVDKIKAAGGRPVRFQNGDVWKWQNNQAVKVTQ